LLAAKLTRRARRRENKKTPPHRRPLAPRPSTPQNQPGLRHSGEWGTEHLTLLMQYKKDSAGADRVLAAEVARRTKAGETMRGLLRRLAVTGWAAPLSPALHPATLAEAFAAREEDKKWREYPLDIVMLAHDRTGTKRRRSYGDGVDGVVVVNVVEEEDERGLKKKKKTEGKKEKKKKSSKKEKKAGKKDKKKGKKKA
jgi:hypothetical protein